MDQDLPPALSPPLGDPAAPDLPTPSPRRKPEKADWIEARLRALYDDVAAEPLPPALQALADRLREDG